LIHCAIIQGDSDHSIPQVEEYWNSDLGGCNVQGAECMIGRGMVDDNKPIYGKKIRQIKRMIGRNWGKEGGKE
jgi:hypothetical protein